MKKKILHILCWVVLFFCITACGVSRNAQHTDADIISGYTRMEYTMDRVLGKSQVDSMITIDRLQGLDKWIPSKFGTASQYVFIKAIGENELIYTVTTTKVDTLYKCTKRVKKTIDE